MGKSIAHLLKLLKIFINILVSVQYPKQNIVLIKHPSFPAFHLTSSVSQSTISSPSFIFFLGKTKFS